MTPIAGAEGEKSWFKAIRATCSWSFAWWHWRFACLLGLIIALRDYKVYHCQHWFDVLWLQQLFVMWPDNWLVQVNFSAEWSIHLPPITTKRTHTNSVRRTMTNCTHVTSVTQASRALRDSISTLWSKPPVKCHCRISSRVCGDILPLRSLSLFMMPLLGQH